MQILVIFVQQIGTSNRCGRHQHLLDLSTFIAPMPLCTQVRNDMRFTGVRLLQQLQELGGPGILESWATARPVELEESTPDFSWRAR